MPDWEQIVRNNSRQVVNAAYRILGNLADAEDVGQEVFAEAFRKWEPDSDQQWAGLLRRLSVCRAIDLLRRRKESMNLELALVDNAMPEPVQSAIANETLSRLRHALTLLAPRESEVFCLVFFEKQKNEQIASVLGMSRASVATALSRARAKLEKIFLELSTGETR